MQTPRGDTAARDINHEPFVHARSLEDAVRIQSALNSPVRTAVAEKRVPFEWIAERRVIGGVGVMTSRYRAAVRADTAHVDRQYSLLIASHSAGAATQRRATAQLVPGCSAAIVSPDAAAAFALESNYRGMQVTFPSNLLDATFAALTGEAPRERVRFAVGIDLTSGGGAVALRLLEIRARRRTERRGRAAITVRRGAPGRRVPRDAADRPAAQPLVPLACAAAGPRARAHPARRGVPEGVRASASLDRRTVSGGRCQCTCVVRGLPRSPPLLADGVSARPALRSGPRAAAHRARADRDVDRDRVRLPAPRSIQRRLRRALRRESLRDAGPWTGCAAPPDQAAVAAVPTDALRLLLVAVQRQRHCTGAGSTHFEMIGDGAEVGPRGIRS